MGVDLFFVLSGFLITGILISNKELSFRGYIGAFYKRRALRILPPYVLLMLVASLLFGVAWAKHWYLYSFFMMNLIPPLGIATPDALSTLWSLAVEEQFYLAWPFLVFFADEAVIGWTAVALIISAPILRGLCTPLFARHWAIYMLTPFRLDCLSVGALIAIAWRHHRDKIKKYGHFGLLATAIVPFAFRILSKRPGFSTYANTVEGNVVIYELTLIACTGLILWALSGRGTWALTLPPVIYVGRISYTIYLIHLAVLIVLLQHFQSQWLTTLLGLVITLLYASLSWYFVERPLLNMGTSRVPSLGS
jgi:peptidoglycan/LPS O-acetylase OafA/YrhL